MSYASCDHGGTVWPIDDTCDKCGAHTSEPCRLAEAEGEGMVHRPASSEGGYGHMRARLDSPLVNKGNTKFDVGKVDLTFLFDYFPDALEAVCYVSDYGDRKYARGGWRAVELVRYVKAFWRHLFKDARGIKYDEESGLAHAAHMLWNDMAMLQKRIESGELEQRRGNEIKNGKPVPDTFRIIT